MTWSDFFHTPIAPITFMIVLMVTLLYLIDHANDKHYRSGSPRSDHRTPYECPGIWPGDYIDGCSGGHSPETPTATRPARSHEPLVVRTRPTVRRVEADHDWLFDQPAEMPIEVPDWPVRVVKK